jgi:CRISPR/Cas system Type II protein with McrA/HNH and RuvC-like nuclease domain
MEAGRLAKAVENVVNSMLKKQVTQLGLAAAVYEIAGPEAKVLFDQATRTILELQKRFYPAELIQIKLGRELGTTFKELVASYERAVDDSGEMPRAGRSSNYP